MTKGESVVKKQQLLFELLVVLFEKFSRNLGIKEVEKFTLVSKGEKDLECKMIALPRKNESKQPHLVLIDHRQIGFNKIDIILLSERPKIIGGKVSSTRQYGWFSIRTYSRDTKEDESSDIKLIMDGQTSYSGNVNIGNPFHRHLYLYMTDIIRMSDELYFSKKYEFVTKYNEKDKEIIPLEIRGEEVKQKKEI